MTVTFEKGKALGEPMGLAGFTSQSITLRIFSYASSFQSQPGLKYSLTPSISTSRVSQRPYAGDKDVRAQQQLQNINSCPQNEKGQQMTVT